MSKKNLRSTVSKRLLITALVDRKFLITFLSILMEDRLATLLYMFSNLFVISLFALLAVGLKLQVFIVVIVMISVVKTWKVITWIVSFFYGFFIGHLCNSLRKLHHISAHFGYRFLSLSWLKPNNLFPIYRTLLDLMADLLHGLMVPFWITSIGSTGNRTTLKIKKVRKLQV